MKTITVEMKKFQTRIRNANSIAVDRLDPSKAIVPRRSLL